MRAVAMFVAHGTLCTSQARTSALMSGFVGLCGHGVAQEDHRIDFTHCQARADLQVAAQRTAEQALHVQAHV